MSDFRTTFTIPTYPKPLAHRAGILLIGSCFSESIGGLLHQHKVPTLSNPLGTLFNPISIFKALQFITTACVPDKHFITQQQDTWFHYDAHSAIKGESKAQLTSNFLTAIKTAQLFVATANTLIITLGTAFVYEHVETGEIVANCHKTPQKVFKKRLVTAQEISTQFEKLYPSLAGFEHIIFTLSPVRHTKDTIPLNSVSKSILRVVCHELQEKYEKVSYFPSYELLMDDLRDYRFYKNDFIHPTDFAVNYVWEKFKKTYFSENTKKLLEEINAVQQRLAHKPFNIETETYLKFKTELLKKLEYLNQHVDFSKEITTLKN